MKNKQKIMFSIAMAVVTFLLASGVQASEVIGTLSTGISTPGVVGVVIAPPVAAPSAGAYTATQIVSLVSDGSSSIRYTTDGSTPTCGSGQVYTGPVSVASSMVLEAIACYPNNQESSVASYSYTINLSQSQSVSSGGGGGGRSGSRGQITDAVPSPVSGEVLGASTGFQFTRVLTLGSQGDDVKELQNRLTAEGVYSVPISGYFGSLTFSAVKAFQLKYGIPQTGTVGPKTLEKLNGGSAVLGASTGPMSLEEIKAMIVKLQAMLADLIAKQKALQSSGQ